MNTVNLTIIHVHKHWANDGLFLISFPTCNQREQIMTSYKSAHVFCSVSMLLIVCLDCTYIIHVEPVYCLVFIFKFICLW